MERVGNWSRRQTQLKRRLQLCNCALNCLGVLPLPTSLNIDFDSAMFEKKQQLGDRAVIANLPLTLLFLR